ncbi:DNA glycosylase AlkZ-like family protein [Anaerocolumna aminovalerica]|uniref:DNA glycosylase AlkZ-like family protein n=1 Tax=Anaerocolumna aminovalerica TaxID=1527 RepID=UPI000BE45CA3|nr:crosslink repair DNA glycosylase YcaQ family protein [Anaerocolumna aminovalerica]
MIHISKEEARNYLVRYHNLDGIEDFYGEEGVLKYFRRVGSIQYDPLNVVGRNPDLVLQSRIKDYSHEMLGSLLYEKRCLLDGWDKMMSIYSREDWPFFSRVRKEKEVQIKELLKRRNSVEAFQLIDEIRIMLKEQGPLQSNRIPTKTTNPGSWGHRKLSSAALDFMFHTGELGIYNKINTQKVYDLIENLLPHNLIGGADPFQSDHEFCKWYVKRRIGSVGLLWNKNGGGWLGDFIQKKELRNEIIKELIEEGEILEIQVEGINAVFYIRKEDKEFFNNKLEYREARFLAPLDNMLWDREMTKAIFDFDYSWEVYVPINKRKYGYYVLPVLYKNRFVARFEPEIHRNNDPLIIKNWWWENDIEITADMKSAIENELENFCRYLHCESVQMKF